MTEPRWLSADEQHSWLHFIGVVELLPGALDTQLGNDAGITHYEYLVMAVLSESPGRSLRMTDLATRTNATLPRLSRVVLGLEQRGHVERTSHPGDRRAKIAKLSDSGMLFLEETAPGHVGKVRELIVDALTPEEFSTLGRISQKLLDRIDPEDRFGVHRTATEPSGSDSEPIARLGIGAPATRALADDGQTLLGDVAGRSREHLLSLHGVGPRAVGILEGALEARGLAPLQR